MKEPITERDLFVISTICTGFGVLLAWGLFYNWGSAPSVKQIDLSGWVQAIGTLIAITIAIAVPHQVYAKERRERDFREEASKRDRIEITRLRSKALAVEFLPVAGRFRAALQSIMADVGDSEIEYQSLKTNRFQTAVTELREWSPKIVDLQLAGEYAMDAVAAGEAALACIADWDFYEVHTWNGVIEDPERGIYEVFPEPKAPMPILRKCLMNIDNAIQLMNAKFH